MQEIVQNQMSSPDKKVDYVISTRPSIHSSLTDYCYLSKEHGYIEITEWTNGDGFDIDLSSHEEQYMRMTWGQFKLLKKLVKKLEKYKESFS